MTKKLVVFLGLGAATLVWAADFWEKKPVDQWTEKEASRLIENSPWAKTTAGTMSGGGGPGGGGPGAAGGMSGRGRRGGGGMGGGVTDASVGAGPGPGGGGGMRGGDMGPGGGGPGGGGPGGGGPPAINALVRWQSAKPVKEAVLKIRFGAEMKTSKEAQELLAREEPAYVIVLDNLPERMGRMLTNERMKPMLMANTGILRKDKETLRAADVQMFTREKFVGLVFAFPKSDPIVAEDKEVEFAMKMGPLEFKKKFKLADMMYGGKLEL